jgi:hypothetical protein
LTRRHFFPHVFARFAAWVSDDFDDCFSCLPGGNYDKKQLDASIAAATRFDYTLPAGFLDFKGLFLQKAEASCKRCRA